MKIAVIGITKNASFIANELGKRLKGDVYVKEKYAYKNNYLIEGEFIDFVHKIFNDYEGFIFVMAAGIVVRSIAGVIKDKYKDPAVVVIDEKGKYAISLLSGHVGRANELCYKAAKAIGAIPVITTATDIEKVPAIDIIARDFKYYIENEKDLKKISSALVNGENVRFIFEEQSKLIKKLEKHINNDFNDNADAFVYITEKEIDVIDNKPFIILRPKNIVIGIGCKKDISGTFLIDFVKEAFRTLKLSLNSVKAIGTIDIKKDEKGIKELSEFLDAPIKYFPKEELKKVEDKFPVSDFVFHTVGVGSVARPSAYLLSNNGKEIVYLKKDGITIALYKIEEEGKDGMG